MQKRGVPAIEDPRDHHPHQPLGQPLAPVVRMGGNGTDLSPSDRPHPLAGHGDQPALVTDADVPSEFVGPRGERARAGQGHEFEHVVHIVGTERQHVGSVGSVGSDGPSFGK